MRNAFQQLRELLAPAPLMVGEVLAIGGGLATIGLPGGGLLQVRGAATVGATVFVRDGVIEGEAPDLPFEEIEV